MRIAMKLPTRLAAASLLLLTCTAPALAQMDSREAIALQNQILELRAQLQQMQQGQATGGYPQSGYQAPPIAPPSGDQQAYSGAPGVSDATAQLVVRVGALEEQVRDLQGKVDDLTNQLQRQNDQLTKQIGDLQFKLGQGSGASAAPAPAGDSGQLGDIPADVPPPAPHHTQPDMPAPAAPRRTAENALREGNAALARRDYAAAAADAREVIAAHGVRSNDAQLLLARAEAGQHEYRQAAADYYLAYNHAPKGSAAPVALLGVANTLIDMNDNNDACQALDKLRAEFPQASSGVRAAEASIRKRAACH